jgi:DNA-binding SARP family transcriptional activator
MDDVRLHLLGPPRIEYQGLPVRIERRKAMALAAYLACAGHRQSREVLADLLWPDLDHEHARSALRSALLALTTPISLDWIEADRATLALKWDVVWVDVREFSATLSGRDSHGHSPTAVCDQCAAVYERAVVLYQSGFMAGFGLSDCADFADWQMSQREWLRREFADVLRRLSLYFAEAQRYAEAIK